jgi:hypothetical protein
MTPAPVTTAAPVTTPAPETTPASTPESAIAGVMAALAVVVVTSLTAIRIGLADMPPTRRADIPGKMDPTQAEPWMADCLPGIGPARRDAAAEAIRSGRALPVATAAAALPGWFALPSANQTE